MTPNLLLRATGGMVVYSGANVSLSSSRFAQNSASTVGGGVYVRAYACSSRA